MRAGLCFSPKGPSAKARGEIASAFWKLLLRDPGHVHPYCDGVLRLDNNDIYIGSWHVISYERDEYSCFCLCIDPTSDPDYRDFTEDTDAEELPHGIGPAKRATRIGRTLFGYSRE